MIHYIEYSKYELNYKKYEHDKYFVYDDLKQIKKKY